MKSTVASLNTRLRIEYADQNEEFARYLPRVGVVERELRDTKGGGPWFLIRLDVPFEYQLKIAEPFQFRLAHIDAFLIRSRWEGHEVGDSHDVSVFLLLVERGQHPVDREIDLRDFVHIAWAMCRPDA